MRAIFTRDSQSGFRALFFIVLSISVMIADKKWEKFNAVRSLLATSMVPIHYLIEGPIRAVNHLTTLTLQRENLIQENQALQAEQLLLKVKLQRMLALEAENIHLKALLHSSKQINGKTLVAELLAVQSEPFTHQIILDKGTRDGVFLGQAVLDAEGMMGQVIDVNGFSSRVLLITDPHAGIALQNVRTGQRAIAVGDGYHRIKLLYVAKTTDIKVGDLFMTSGLGDHFPPGYPVGKVIAIEKDPAHPFADILLAPNAQLNRSRQVLLIWNHRHG